MSENEFKNDVAGSVIANLTSTVNSLSVGISTQIEYIRSQSDSEDNKKVLMKLHRVRSGLNTIKGILEE